MSAQPIHHEAPPTRRTSSPGSRSRVHPTFLQQHEDAVQRAHAPVGYRGLVELLHVWSLRADAYAEPGYRDRRQEAMDAAAGSRGMSPEEPIAARRAR